MSSKPWRQRHPLTQVSFQQCMKEHLAELIELCGPGWPVECCGDTCGEIVADLQAQFRGNFYIKRGQFDDEMPFRPAHHTWIEEVHSHTIVDPTIGQFRNCDQLKKPIHYDDGLPYRLFTPADPEYNWYIKSPCR